MNSAEEILRAIESVSPEHEELLNSIDARVYAFLKLYDGFTLSFGGNSIYYRHDSWDKESKTHLLHLFDDFQYTRSRGLLKSIRPCGWFPQVNRFNKTSFDGFEFAECFKASIDHERYTFFNSPKLPTEELAELHAVIQAINYMRSLENA